MKDQAKKILNYSIEVFFFTDIWVYGYLFILSYLNKKFPPHIPNIFLSTVPKDILQPEPFEIPLYVLFTFIMTLIIYIYIIKIRTKLWDSIKFVYTKLLFLSILIYLFYIRLGSYTLENEYFPPNSFNLLLYLFVIALLFIIIPVLHFLYIYKVKYIRYSLFIIIIIIIGLFTFEPKFPVHRTDVMFYYGPIIEVASGKTIYTDITSQYGFLNILIFSLLIKLGLLTISYTSYITWLLYILEYFVIFYLVYKISKSSLLSFVALFSVITINYYQSPGLPISSIYGGSLRWAQLVFATFFLYKIKKIDSKLYIFLISLMSFLVVDTGIMLLLGYLFLLFLTFLKQIINFKQMLKSVAYLILFMVLIFSTINLSHLLSGLKQIDLVLIFSKINQYSRLGLMMLPIPDKTYFWFVMLVFFSTLIYFFKSSSFDKTAIIVMSSACFSFFGGFYYLGRSHPQVLISITHLFLLNLFLLLGNYYLQIKLSKGLRRTFILTCCLLFIIYPIFLRPKTMTKIFDSKFYFMQMDNIFIPEMDDNLESYYLPEINLIKDNMQEDKIIILSPDDTYLFYLTQKKNLLDEDPAITINTRDDLKFAVKEVVKVCPKKIAAYCEAFNDCPKDVRTLVDKSHHPSLILKKIEEECHIKYAPTKCTDKNRLCIAEANINN